MGLCDKTVPGSSSENSVSTSMSPAPISAPLDGSLDESFPTKSGTVTVSGEGDDDGDGEGDGTPAAVPVGSSWLLRTVPRIARAATAVTAAMDQPTTFLLVLPLAVGVGGGGSGVFMGFPADDSLNVDKTQKCSPTTLYCRVASTRSNAAMRSRR